MCVSLVDCIINGVFEVMYLCHVFQWLFFLCINMIMIWYEDKVAYHVGCEGKALDNVAQATKGKKVRPF